jgi:hypothetical protein
LCSLTGVWVLSVLLNNSGCMKLSTLKIRISEMLIFFKRNDFPSKLQTHSLTVFTSSFNRFSVFATENRTTQMKVVGWKGKLLLQ